MQDKAAGKAAKAQGKAADASIAYERESRDLSLELQRPYREASYAATSALMDLTGLPRARPPGTAIELSKNPFTGKYDNAGGPLGDIARVAGKEAGRQYDEAVGQGNVPQLADYPAYSFKGDPGYQFRMDEGMKALERGAAARGGLLSGGFARKSLRYAQDYASNEYQNVYNRIASIAGFGQVATNNSTGIIMGSAGNVGGAMMNAGEARASGYIAQGNAWSNAINQVGMAAGSGMFGKSMGANQAMNYGGAMYGGGLA
jgi:hypothetical protein